MTKKTKWIRSAFALLFAGCSCLTQAQEAVYPSKNYITREVRVERFENIVLEGSPTIVFTQNVTNRHDVSIYGSDNLVDYIECAVEQGTLYVRFKKNTNIRNSRDYKLQVNVSAPTLNGALLKGSGDLILNNVKSKELELMLKGSGDIVADKIICTTKLTADLSGSGDIRFNQPAESPEVNLTLKGSGDFKTQSVSAQKFNALLNGSGDFKLEGDITSQVISLSLKGSGDFKANTVHAKTLNANCAGSGSLVVSGSAVNANYGCAGSGSLNAEAVKSEVVNAILKGSGSLKCAASKVLNSNVAGSGTLTYYGDPKVNHTGNKNIRKR